MGCARSASPLGGHNRGGISWSPVILILFQLDRSRKLGDRRIRCKLEIMSRNIYATLTRWCVFLGLSSLTIWLPLFSLLTLPWELGGLSGDCVFAAVMQTSIVAEIMSSHMQAHCVSAAPPHDWVFFNLHYLFLKCNISGSMSLFSVKNISKWSSDYEDFITEEKLVPFHSYFVLFHSYFNPVLFLFYSYLSFSVSII